MKNRSLPPFELLETLIAVAESGNFREAAHSLGLSQGAVSLKLKRLQEQVALPIFTLQGRRKILTHFGRELHTFARNQAERLESEYSRLDRKFENASNLKL